MSDNSHSTASQTTHIRRAIKIICSTYRTIAPRGDVATGPRLYPRNSGRGRILRERSITKGRRGIGRGVISWDRPPIRDRRRGRDRWHLGRDVDAGGRCGVLVARGRHAEVLAVEGMKLRTPEGTFHTAVTAASRPQKDVRLTDRDVLVFTTKTQQLDAALQEWVDQPVHGPGDSDDPIGTAGERLPAMTALNGVAAEEKALRCFRRVFGICVWLPAVHLEPGEVIVRSWPVAGQFHIARWPTSVGARADTDLLTDLAETWTAAGIVVRLPDDLAPWKYNKLLSNLGNAVGALTADAGRGRRCGRRGAQGRRKRAAKSGHRIRVVRDVQRRPGGRADHPPGARMGRPGEQLDLAIVEPQHGQRGDRLLQRGDRPDRPPARHRGAGQRRAGSGGAGGGAQRPWAKPLFGGAAGGVGGDERDRWLTRQAPPLAYKNR